jgi:hypothetical protein
LLFFLFFFFCYSSFLISLVFFSLGFCWVSLIIAESSLWCWWCHDRNSVQRLMFDTILYPTQDWELMKSMAECYGSSTGHVNADSLMLLQGEVLSICPCSSDNTFVYLIFYIVLCFSLLFSISVFLCFFGLV